MPPKLGHPDPLQWRCRHLPSSSPSCCPQAQWPCPCCRHLHSPRSPRGFGVGPCGAAGGRAAEQAWLLLAPQLPSAPRGKGSRGAFPCSSLALGLAWLPEMLTMSALKYIKLFYRLYRKSFALKREAFSIISAEVYSPVLCQTGVRHTPQAGRVVLSIPISPPSLLCFPAAAALRPTAEGQSCPSRVCLTGKAEFIGAV